MTTIRRWTVKLTSLHAYLEDYRHLLTRAANPELGVTTSDDGGEW